MHNAEGRFRSLASSSRNRGDAAQCATTLVVGSLPIVAYLALTGELASYRNLQTTSEEFKTALREAGLGVAQGWIVGAPAVAVGGVWRHSRRPDHG